MARARLYVLLGVLAALLAAFGVALAQVTGKPLVGALAAGAVVVTLLTALSAYAAAILLAVVVHEFGHYLAGRAVGFELRNLVAGPFGLRREGARLVPYRVRPARMLGYVSMVPRDDRAYLRRFALFVLGGPVATVLWTAAVFGAWAAYGGPILPELRRGAPAGAVLLAYAMTVMLLGTAVVLPGTLLPYRARRLGGLPTDALWLVLLARGGEEVRRLAAMSTLTRLLLGGTEAKDLPPTLLEEATRLRDGTATELSALTFRWAATAEREPTTARTMLARHAEIQEALGANLTEPSRTWARMVQASAATFEDKDPERSRAWLEGTVEPPDAVLVASMRLVRAGLAALRDDADRAALLDEDEAALEAAAPKTTISLRSERARITTLRAGWPQTPLSSGSEEGSPRGTTTD